LRRGRSCSMSSSTGLPAFTIIMILPGGKDRTKLDRLRRNSS
jgi:hypothetical protein